MLMMRCEVPNLPVRLAEPVGQHAVFGHAVEHAVGANDRRVHRARQNQRAHRHHEYVKHQPQRERPDQIHGQSANQVFQVLAAGVVRNDHHREEGHQRSEQQAVDKNNQAGLFAGSAAWVLRFRDRPAPAIPRRSWPARNGRCRQRRRSAESFSGSGCRRASPAIARPMRMLEGHGNGGRCAPRTHIVYVHQTISSTTITVVICMMRSALWLDSGMPLMFSHQK